MRLLRWKDDDFEMKVKLLFGLVVFACWPPTGRMMARAAAPPKIFQKTRSRDEKIDIAKGQRYQEVCTISEGDLPITFRWLKNGQTLTSSVDTVIRRIDDFSSSIVVESVTEYNSGNYTCVASNAAGTESYTVTLQVNVPPYWTRQPVDSSLLAGDDVQLQCQAGGYPIPKTSWKKSKSVIGSAVNDVKSDNRIRINEDGELSILKATDSDEGFYFCSITNGIGDEIKKTVKVTVLVPPQMSEKYQAVTRKKGHSVEMNCNVTGDTPLQVTWKKELVEVSTSTNDRLSVTQTEYGQNVNSVLKIDRATTSDGGVYICEARNNHGRSEIKFRLTVVETPEKIDTVTILNAWSTTVRLGWKLGSTGNSPITKVTIEYQQLNEYDKKQKSVRPTESSTILENLEPWTSYKIWVMAENEVGLGEPSDVRVATTAAEEPSRSPAHFKVDSVRATTARVSWQTLKREEWYGKPLGYYLGYRNENRHNIAFLYRTILIRPDSNVTQKSFLLTGLERSTSYSLVLSSFNVAGVGPRTDPINLRTKSGVPANTPTISLLSSNGNKAEIEIRQASSDDEVDDFLLHVKRQQNGWLEMPLTTNLASRYTIGGLHGDTQYQIFVTARNGFGTSEPTEVISFKTPQIGMFNEDSDQVPLYMRLWVMAPVAASALLVVVVCIAACCLLKKLESPKRPRKQDGIVADDFSYCAPASLSESGYYPALRSSYPRRSGGSGSTVGLMMAPSSRSVYNEPRNYSSGIEDGDEPKYESVLGEMKTFSHGSGKKSKFQAMTT